MGLPLVGDLVQCVFGRQKRRFARMTEQIPMMIMTVAMTIMMVILMIMMTKITKKTYKYKEFWVKNYKKFRDYYMVK